MCPSPSLPPRQRKHVYRAVWLSCGVGHRVWAACCRGTHRETCYGCSCHRGTDSKKGVPLLHLHVELSDSHYAQQVMHVQKVGHRAIPGPMPWTSGCCASLLCIAKIRESFSIGGSLSRSTRRAFGALAGGQLVHLGLVLGTECATPFLHRCGPLVVTHELG